MQLTNNEKKTLKLLLQNSRTSDSEIASNLKISSQAVGKIRKKLEATIIESYTLNLNFSKLGITIFAVALAKITKEGLDRGQLEVENELLKEYHIINIFRIPKQSSTHILLYGFKDISELDSFFYSQKITEKIHKYIETSDLYTFSHNSIIKNNALQLFSHAIDALGTQNSTRGFKELELFKQNTTYKSKQIISKKK